MRTQAIALFGEAEKGDFRTVYHCRSLPQLLEYLGNPPDHSLGLFYAVQSLMFQWPVLFVRVQEEGFSYPDYLWGSHLLEQQNLSLPLIAIGLPGVGNHVILDAIKPLCLKHHSILIVNEADLYDFLTEEAA